MTIPGKRVATRHYGIMEEWRKKLIEENIALAGYVYGKMRYLPIDDTEKISAANYGLVKAAMLFDPDRGLKFSTFAVPVIRNVILHEARQARKNNRYISLNEGITPEEGYAELGDLVSTGIDSTEEQVMYNMGLEDLVRLSRELKGVEKRVLQICLSHPEWTQKQKAKALGMSQSYESRIEKKIRSYLD